MAINFLDNIQLNQNQLLGARIENVTSDPSTANGGDIIFNSTSGVLKYYDGTNPFNASGWISLTSDTVLPTATSTTIGGVKLFSDTDQSVAANAVSATAGRTYGVQFNSSDQMVVNVPGVGGSGTVGTIPIWGPDTTTIGDSGLTVTGTGASAVLGIAYPTTTVKTLRVQQDLEDVNSQTGTAGQLLSSLGTGNGIDWIDAPVSYTKWILLQGSNFNINDGDTFQLNSDSAYPGINLTTSKTSTVATTLARFYPKDIVATTGLSDYTADFLIYQDTSDSFKAKKTLTGNIPLNSFGTATAAIDMGSNLINNVTNPSAAQDAATKDYVDNAVVGGFNVKGGFNANTGVTAVAGTNLYTNTTVAVGDYYVVTVAGNFFGQASTPLTVGDSVLAQTAAASGSASITDFAVIQSDTDLATSTTVGIGNVNVSGAGALDGLGLSYSSGTATVGVDIKNNPSTSLALGEMVFLVYDGADTGDNLALPIESLATYVNSADDFVGTSSSVTSHVFNHNLNSFQVNVQTYDTASNETVFASVDRTSVNQVTVTTASSASLTCVITKIG